MDRKNGIYGYVDSATQIENYKVAFGFRDVSLRFVRQFYSFRKYLKTRYFVKNLGMYYTNFEICHIPWYSSDIYMSYFNYLDIHNGFMANRWGDAIVRYFAVKSLVNFKQRVPLRGFVYQHGAIYTNSDKFLEILKLKIHQKLQFLKY
jgi:hypothetical protein